MLLTTHLLALGVGALVFVWMIFLHRRACRLEQIVDRAHKTSSSPFHPAERPTIWVAIRSVEPEAVRSVLPDDGKFFISPRVNGWVIITGPDLPNPSEDVDACFLFLTALSRELGHVQFFHAEKFSHHHAWARLDEGCVTRAYAWAGETVWNQGDKTYAEIALRMKCSGYGENSVTNEIAEANLEKIPLLASRWSVDPIAMHRADGIAGESSRLY